MLFDWLIVGQVLAINPAHAVHGPKHVVNRGKNEAAKNSRNRRAARSPASAIIAGTASEIVSVDVVTGVAVSTTAGRLPRSPLTATPYR
jgi:hypothetical protein